MKSIFKKVLAVMISAIFVLAAPVASFADSFQPGQDTQIVLQFYAQNDESEVEPWLWANTPGDEGNIFYLGVAGHYEIPIDAKLFEGMENPNKSFGIMVGFYNGPSGGKSEIGMSFQNMVLKFNGYDDLVIPSALSTEAEEIIRNGFRLHFNKYLPADGSVDIADMLRNIVSLEFDAAIIYLNVYDADGNEYVVEPTEAEPEETTVEETTVKETTVKETTVEETTIKETTVKETTAKETTIEESQDEEESAEEAVETTAAESKKDSKDSNSIKIIVTIVFAVILLAALGFVAFTYVKKK